MAIPQAGRHTATIFGLMNGLGVLGAMASQGFVGVFADWQTNARADRPRAVGPALRRVRGRAARERGRVVALPLHAASGPDRYDTGGDLVIIDVHSHFWEYPRDFTADFREQAKRAKGGADFDLTVRYEDYRAAAAPGPHHRLRRQGDAQRHVGR